MAIYSGFTHKKWWFSIAMLVHQRVHTQSNRFKQLGPTIFLWGYCLSHPPKKKKTNTLQRLMGWFASWNQITSNSHHESWPNRPCNLVIAIVCWGSIPSKHSNGNHPDNPRHVDDVPCTNNFEHFALPAMLRQSSWDSEVGYCPKQMLEQGTKTRLWGYH